MEIIIDFLMRSENFFFSVSLMIILLISIIEFISFFLGLGASIFQLSNSILPDSNFDLDNLDFEPSFVFAKLFGWIKFGKVPFLIIFIVYFFFFGSIGIFIQIIYNFYFNSFLPIFITLPLSIISAFLCTVFFNNLFVKYFSPSESSAVELETLVGREAIVLYGNAKKDYPAQGKVKDEFGRTHYVMIGPQADSDIFCQGERVVLVERKNNIFYAVLYDL